MKIIGNYTYDTLCVYVKQYIRIICKDNEWFEKHEPEENKELTIAKNFTELSEVCRELNFNLWQFVIKEIDVSTYKRLTLLYKRARITENKRNKK